MARKKTTQRKLKKSRGGISAQGTLHRAMPSATYSPIRAKGAEFHVTISSPFMGEIASFDIVATREELQP